MRRALPLLKDDASMISIGSMVASTGAPGTTVYSSTEAQRRLPATIVGRY
jgi:hypothetical protein